MDLLSSDLNVNIVEWVYPSQTKLMHLKTFFPQMYY